MKAYYIKSRKFETILSAYNIKLALDKFFLLHPGIEVKQIKKIKKVINNCRAY